MPSAHDAGLNGVSRFSTNTVLERDQSQWLFTQEDLKHTPSIVDGLPEAQELANRQKGVNFITQVGIMLKLPQLTLATASVYLHRFFMRHSMQQPGKAGLHHYSAAATALFLATKVEENCRKMKELVVACCRVAQKQPNLVVDEQNKEYWKWRDTILQNEDLLLEALCFDLQLEQPYRILFEFLQYYGVQDNKILRNTSWAFLNDSHVTTMCLLHSPRMIAGAALYAGVRLANITLPDDESGRSWWDHLELDVVEIQKACNLMFEVYENPALPRVGAKDAYTREDDMGALENTRGYLSPRPEMSPRSVRSTSVGVKRDRTEVEGDQSEEWGAPSQPSQIPGESGAPSPKRQRVETPHNPSPAQRPSRIPPGANGSRVPPGPAPPQPQSNDDDVQKRIDDIVNASSSSSNGHASLASRPSSAQYGHSGPPSRRRSDAASNWQRPPSPDSSLNTRPEAKNKVNLDKANGSLLTRQDSIDDAEKVDYGSEEGEV